jgi:predicted transcriptional regulator YheO
MVTKRVRSMTESPSALLSAFIPMVDFLAEVLGEGCEVVLHDVTNPERSVIAIRNSHVSGRDVALP